MKIHNRTRKQRATPFGKPNSTASKGGGKPALAGQRSYAEQIWARWQAAEAAENKEKPVAPLQNHRPKSSISAPARGKS